MTRQVTISIIIWLFLASCVATAQTGNGPINYIYDDLGRLVGAVDSQDNVAIYSYDAVGNILSI